MLEIVVTLITAFSNVLLGLFTYFKNPKSATNRFFVILTVIVAGWASANYFSLHSSSPETTLFWIRVVMVITSPMGPVIFLLVKTFPSTEINIKRSYFFSIVAFSLLLSFLAVTPLMFSSVSISPEGNIVPKPGPAIALFALSFVGGPILSFITLFFKMRKAVGLERTQLKYFFLGIATTFTLTAITNFIFVVVLKISYFVVFGPLFSLILIGFIAYAIIVHRFMDINLLIARSVAYVLSLIFLGFLYVTAVYILQAFVTNQPLDIVQILSAMLFAVLILFSFQPIKRSFERVTNGIFYRNIINPQDFLQNLGRFIASNIVFTDLINEVGAQIESNLKVSHVYVVILDNVQVGLFDKVKYQLPVNVSITEVTKFLKLIFKSGPRLYVLEEQTDEGVKKVMSHFGFSLIIPLVVNNKIIGALMLGQKISGEIFSRDDIELVKIVAPQLAVGIQNALSYEEIKRFNVTLQEKVDQATSDLKTANSKLTSTNEKLKQLDKLKDEFVSIASHELRTPLTAIKGYLWLALNKSPQPLPDEVKKNLSIALDSNERLARLVEDMLTISRIESQRISLNPTNFDINNLFKEIYDELLIKAQSKEIDFNVEYIDQGLPVVWDKDRVREVVTNLIGNALKFTPDKGKISVSLKQVEESVLIRISDTGPGISKEDQEKLFQKFSRLDSSYEKTKESGSGLGLYISKQIVDLHKGAITVQSELKKGTTFTVKLPTHPQLDDLKEKKRI